MEEFDEIMQLLENEHNISLEGVPGNCEHDSTNVLEDYTLNAPDSSERVLEDRTMQDSSEFFLEDVVGNCDHNLTNVLDEDIFEDYTHNSPDTSQLVLEDCMMQDSSFFHEDVLENNFEEDSLDIFDSRGVQAEEEMHNVCSPDPPCDSELGSPSANSLRVDELDENENNDDENYESFLGLAEIAQQYKIQECVNDDVVTRQKNKICALFASEHITHKGQRRFLEMFREITTETQKALPIQGRTLRPKTIPHVLIDLPPGEFVYFGITSILALTGFYNPEENTIRLMVNTDGTPPFHSGGYNFWPILAAVDEYPEWMIALYGGPSKPKCSNEFLSLFVREICQLQRDGIRLQNKIYKFELLNMLMDIPATTYILGTKGNGGYFACRRCNTKGESVTLAE